MREPNHPLAQGHVRLLHPAPGDSYTGSDRHE